MICLSTAMLKGLTLTGEIRLQVKDASGAAMVASGNLENLSAGINRNFQTDELGTTTFTDLPYGRYRLDISQTGFASESVLVDVESTTPITRTITLAVSSPAFNVDVVGTTPLSGVDLSQSEFPTTIQKATQRDFEESGALDLSDLMNRRLNGVYLNEVQGNPIQPDLNYLGYTASPLLGTPQGISVYMDGVRLNQPFGDVVNWDLIPRLAISEITLIPGSNPLFGLNTLGGALSIQTKVGRKKQGTELELSGGSFGRRMADVEYGGASANGLNWYLASSLFFEDGWRASSPSNVRQFLGKIGWRGLRTAVNLTVAYANNALNGNGLQDVRLLQRDFASVYTRPDITGNRSPFVNLTAQHAVSSKVQLSGNLYYRYIRTNTFNGDINENALDQSVYQPSAAEIAALTAVGYKGFPIGGANAANTPFPFWRCIGNVLLRDEPGEKCNGLINRTHVLQRNYGASGQMHWYSSPTGGRNRLTAGAAYDRSGVGFRQLAELGYLNPDHSITGVGAFGDGITGGNVDGEPFDARVDLQSRIHTWSFYATDTLSIGNFWNITLSGRHNRTMIANSDQIRPGGGSGSLDGNSVFSRFNPAVGVSFNPTHNLNAYFNYNESSRAPTSVELGCADPNQPCKLPNAMAGDPPLHQVITRTLEAGLRGGAESKLSWNAGWFRAENRNDILFVTSGQTGFGYFKNFGKTRRQGVELDLALRITYASIGAGYTFLDATFQSPEELNGTSNSTNENSMGGIKGVAGTISINPGNLLPLIPRHMVKAYSDVQITPKLWVDVSMTAFSSTFARGNENNLHQPDGTYYLGSGQTPGYGIVNFGTRYQFRRWLQMFVQINNLFDRTYYTAAQLGPVGFTVQGRFVARPFPAVNGEFPVQQTTFLAPGSPRGVWGGVRLHF